LRWRESLAGSPRLPERAIDLSISRSCWLVPSPPTLPKLRSWRAAPLAPLHAPAHPFPEAGGPVRRKSITRPDDASVLVTDPLFFGMIRGVVPMGLPAVAADADGEAVVELATATIRRSDRIMVEFDAIAQLGAATLTGFQPVDAAHRLTETAGSCERFASRSLREFGASHRDRPGEFLRSFAIAASHSKRNIRTSSSSTAMRRSSRSRRETKMTRASGSRGSYET
jgi:hypothetical protein